MRASFFRWAQGRASDAVKGKRTSMSGRFADAVGRLYQDSPLQLCNAYLLGDQVRLGGG